MLNYLLNLKIIKMRKLMFAIALLSLSLGVSANSADLLERTNLSEYHYVSEAEAPTSWSVRFDCGGGRFVTECCFASYIEAAVYAHFARPCEEEVEAPE